MISGRRKTCQEFTGAGLPIFSYRFDTPLWNAAVTAGAQRKDNWFFVFVHPALTDVYFHILYVKPIFPHIAKITSFAPETALIGKLLTHR